MKLAATALVFLTSVSCVGNYPIQTSPAPVRIVDPDQVREWWEGLPPEKRDFLYAIDIALNQILPGLPGEAVPGMTISERAALAAREGDARARAICALLDAFDPGHCEKAIRQR